MTNDQFKPSQPKTLTLLFLAAFLFPASLFAAPPKVNYFFPPGGHRGQTVTVTASGDFSTWPVKVWADRQGIAVEAEQDKGKFKVTIAPDAIPGVVWLRAYNEEGASPLRPFVVGTLPEVEEAEPNDAPGKPQTVAEKVVINGRMAKNGDVDAYAVSLKQGQTLVASLQANTILGSPMDAVLQICEVVKRRGQAEAFVIEQNHDAVGLDPQAVLTAARDGNYLVRVFAFPSEPGAGVNFSGGDNFVYRLTITTSGFIDHALPLAIVGAGRLKAGLQQEVKIFGLNLPADGTSINIQPPTDPLEPFVAAFHPDFAGSFPLLVVDAPILVADPSSDPAKPQAIDLPVVVSGRLDRERGMDAFTFTAKKGTKIRIASESRGFDSPLVPLIRVLDDSRKRLVVGEVSREKRSPDFVFTSPADGQYVVMIADQHGRDGLRFVYRLTMEESKPSFALSLAADSFVLTADKPLEIPVTIDRQNGFAEPIEIKATIVGVPPSGGAEEDRLKPELQRTDPVISEGKGDTAKSVKLVLKASADAAPGSFAIRIVGTSGGLSRAALFSVGLPLAEKQSAVWITKKP